MPQTSPGRRRRGAAAVLLSLSAHVGLLLALAALPTRAPRRGLSVETTVVEGCTLSIAPLPGPHPRPGLLDGGVRLKEPDEVELPIDLAPPHPPSPAAGVKGPPAGPAAPAALGGSGSPSLPGAGQGGGAGLLPVPPGARRVVYVIDHSVSMGLHGALRLALHELLASLGRLPDGTQFQVVLYNHHAETLRLNRHYDLAVLDAATRQEVAQAVADLAASGGSDHRAALTQALNLRPDVLYLVTDGAELSAAEVNALTLLNRARNQGRTAIHAVELGRGRADDSPLRSLASANGGTYRRVPPAE
jgi:hypothetical protein